MKTVYILTQTTRNRMGTLSTEVTMCYEDQAVAEEAYKRAMAECNDGQDGYWHGLKESQLIERKSV